MNYLEALDYIHMTLKFGIKCGLDNIKVLLSFMGDPQDKLKYIHVAGTNGKGSTCSYINNILISAGLKTGLYTSPYLECFNERIRINNTYISDEDISSGTSFIKEKIDEMLKVGYNHPTEFEIVTALGFKYFADKECDIVVLEVGLGGQFDATNIITKPEVSVITTISYDHMNILGNSLSQIAFEKAGIIKENTPLVLYPQKEEAFGVIMDKCKAKNSTCYNVDLESLHLQNYTENYQEFDYKSYKSLKISMLGDYQLLNAATAIETINLLVSCGYTITDENIYEGLSKTSWPGRFEILSRKPLFVIDGAHNVEGASALSTTMYSHYKDYKKVIILGLLKDKDISNILSIISSFADHIITVTPFSDRGMNAKELSSIIKNNYPNVIVEASEDLSSAIEIAQRAQLSLDKDDHKSLICACGSLYYIGEVRKHFVF